MSDSKSLLPHQSQSFPSMDLHAPTGAGKSVSRAMLAIILEREIGKPSSGKSSFVPGRYIGPAASGRITGQTLLDFLNHEPSKPKAEVLTDVDVPLGLLNSEEIYALLMKGVK
jgi:hypothetical protein